MESRSRLVNSALDDNNKYPIYLSKHKPITELIIQQQRKDLYHARIASSGYPKKLTMKKSKVMMKKNSKIQLTTKEEDEQQPIALKTRSATKGQLKQYQVS